MRVVLDTNVLLSAVFTRGICEAVLDECIAHTEIQIILSGFILDEFAEHAHKFGASRTDIREAVGFLKRNAEIVEPAAVPRDACDDRDDLPVLGTAVAGRASRIVTGDTKLQAIGRFREIAIVSPRAFYDLLRGPGETRETSPG